MKEKTNIVNCDNKKAKNNRKKSLLKGFLVFFLVVFIVIIITLGIFMYKVSKNGGGISGLATTIVNTNQDVIKNLPPVYVVLLGKSQNLTDTIMLVKYEPKEQKASMLSIPRDTFIGNSKANADPRDKINALCQGTNPEKTVAAVSKLTGIPVTNYILVDTKIFRELVDLIGGVYFNVPIDMDYEDFTQGLYIHVKAGYQLLDGETAEGVVRFRHNQDGTTYSEEYGEQDFGRTRTQREFLKAMAKQILQAKNIFKIGELLDLAYNSIKTNITMAEFKDYIPALVNFNPDNLQADRLPGKPQFLNGYSFVINDEIESKMIVEKLFSEQLETDDTKKENGAFPKLVGEGIKVEILNGTSNSNTLKNLEKKLVENGYTVIGTETTSKISKTVIINNTGKEEKVSNDLKTIVGLGKVEFNYKETSDSDFTIIIGADY